MKENEKMATWRQLRRSILRAQNRLKYKKRNRHKRRMK